MEMDLIRKMEKMGQIVKGREYFRARINVPKFVDFEEINYVKWEYIPVHNAAILQFSPTRVFPDLPDPFNPDPSTNSAELAFYKKAVKALVSAFRAFQGHATWDRISSESTIGSAAVAVIKDVLAREDV